MATLRYTFSKYSEKDIMVFLKAAQSQNRNYCQVQGDRNFDNLLPWEANVEKWLEKSKENEVVPVICISDSDDDDDNVNIKEVVEQVDEGNDQNCESLINITTMDKTLAVSRTEDVCALILENLQTDKYLSDDVMSNLQSMSVQQVNDVFTCLQHCTADHITHMGESLLSIHLNDDHLLLTCFLDVLLINKIIQEYNVRLGTLLNSFAIKCPSMFVDLLLHKLLTSGEDVNVKVLSQYASSMVTNYKAQLLRGLLFGLDRLEEKHMGLIEALLHDNLDNDLVKKLAEMMSSNADEFSKDKSYGKLLYTLMQLLGLNAKILEQPFKYIISRHTSVWKARAKKLFDSNFNNSILLTQTLPF